MLKRSEDGLNPFKDQLDEYIKCLDKLTEFYPTDNEDLNVDFKRMPFISAIKIKIFNCQNVLVCLLYRIAILF